MPLDAFGFIELRTLSTTVERLGITPISRQVLDAHKAAEVAKNPGHWLAPYASHYQRVLVGLTVTAALMTLLGLIGVICGCCLQDVRISVGGGCFGLAAASACVFFDSLHMRTFKIKSAARWQEFSPSTFTIVPQPILDLAMMIRNELPQATFTMGQLVQDAIILDPYLVIRDGDEIAILGIWDDIRIIEIATVTKGNDHAA